MKLVYSSSAKPQSATIELDIPWSQPVWFVCDLPIPNVSDRLPEKLLNRKYDFEKAFSDPVIREQIQYGCMRAFVDGDWSYKAFNDLSTYLSHISRAIAELGSVRSLLDKDWAEWENCLIEWYRENFPKRFRYKKKVVRDAGSGLRQEQKELILPDGIGRFRRIYSKVSECLSSQGHQDEWGKDDVDFEKLGLWNKGNVKVLRTSLVEPVWLREYFKAWAKEKIARGCSPNTASRYLTGVRIFGAFVGARGIEKPEDINRKVLLAFIRYVAQLKTTKASVKQNVGEKLHPVTQDGYVRGVVVFIKESGRWSVGPFPKEELLWADDYPDIPRNDEVHYIPEYVVKQMLSNLSNLAYPWSSIMAVGLHVGCRISDCLQIPHDCLIYDDEKAPYLLVESQKTRVEYNPLPIVDKEVFETIIDAQVRAVEIAGDRCRFLFPSDESGGYYHPQSGKYRFRNWIFECGIKDVEGNFWQFNFKQCRSTTGMRIINNGGTEFDVQYQLGQLTLAVGRKYARLADTVKKDIWAKHKGIVVDAMGRKVADLADVNSPEAQWLKFNLKTQSLSNGWCKKPVQDGTCKHANKCLSCNSFRTSPAFLPIHKDHLHRCKIKIAEAEADGNDRVKQLNEHTLFKLERIISGLKEHERGACHE